jgi:hypothetical protein|tara:strand:- start:1245 stop:1433 length:189 start_codon:yes stop_codon:yes gene_type:complete
MKNRRKFSGWAIGVFAVTLMTGSSAMAADGDPDAKQEVRDVAAISKLKKLENISLFYVKGMT